MKNFILLSSVLYLSLQADTITLFEGENLDG